MTVPLVRTPKDMDELNAMLPDMRGSQADLARVAIMAQSIGFDEGWDAAHKAMTEHEQPDPLDEYDEEDA